MKDENLQANLAKAISEAKTRGRPKTLHHSDEVIQSEIVHNSRNVVDLESGKVIVLETIIHEVRRIVHVTKWKGDSNES